MIVGVGVDLVDTRRIARSIERFGDRFVNRILHPDELRSGLSQIQLASYVARQFSAKEAVSKALGTGMRSGVHFGNILVLRNTVGAPTVSLNGSAAELSERLGIGSINISLSDERHYAIAYAIAESVL
jgi:holo-[acyl-carrier protein] synthase